ncbi:NfeD family protein [Streptomyces malaysiensis]|uniref:NfeD family protein n=1 Tax=Streptomyces malaysiensis TaxID=92644 RepID=UPI00321FF251
MTAVQTSAELSGATAGRTVQDQYPAGAQVLVRDEEWLVKSSAPTTDDGTRLEVVGVSEFVRDQEAVLFSGLDRIELLDPRDTRLVPDDSPNYRRSRLFLEAVLHRTALPQSERPWRPRRPCSRSR